MRVVALLTDFGLKDNFAGVMKGVILKINPSVNFVDITHNVEPQNIFEGAFLLYQSFKFFPEGTVFLSVVDPGVGSERKAVAVKAGRYYFVGPDNGLLSLAVKEEGVDKIVELVNKKYFLPRVSSTFHGRDVFAPAAGFLSSGVKIEKLGREGEKIKEISIPNPVFKDKEIYFDVLYIDRFGNIITNMENIDFIDKTRNKKFKCSVNGRCIEHFCSAYDLVPDEGILSFLPGSSGFIEVSLKNASASEFLNIKKRSRLRVDLMKSKPR